MRPTTARDPCTKSCTRPTLRSPPVPSRAQDAGEHRSHQNASRVTVQKGNRKRGFYKKGVVQLTVGSVKASPFARADDALPSATTDARKSRASQRMHQGVSEEGVAHIHALLHKANARPFSGSLHDKFGLRRGVPAELSGAAYRCKLATTRATRACRTIDSLEASERSAIAASVEFDSCSLDASPTGGHTSPGDTL